MERDKASAVREFDAHTQPSSPVIILPSITSSNSLRCVIELNLMRSGTESNPGPLKSATWTRKCNKDLPPLLAHLRANYPIWRFMDRQHQWELLSSIAPPASKTTVFDASFFKTHWENSHFGTSVLLDGNGQSTLNPQQIAELGGYPNTSDLWRADVCPSPDHHQSTSALHQKVGAITLPEIVLLHTDPSAILHQCPYAF